MKSGHYCFDNLIAYDTLREKTNDLISARGRELWQKCGD
jgi:hypothetical protein